MKSGLNRSEFIKLAGLASGGLVLAVYLDGCRKVTPETATPTNPPILPTATIASAIATPSQPAGWAPNIYLRLDDTGTLTIYSFRSEMGQGIRTALAMLIADELDVEWERVRIEQVPNDKRYGAQHTGGSVSLSSYYYATRSAGAAARLMLLQAAGQAWKVDPAQCRTEAGCVLHPDGQQKLAYAELVDAASRLSVPDRPALKEKSQWKIAGQGLGHWDTPQIVAGKAIYGLDVRLPGMYYAVLARCPVFGGRPASFDDSAARAVPGVRQIFPVGNAIAVVADHTWAAIQGRNALAIQWDEGESNTLDSDVMRMNAVDSLPKPGSRENMLDAIYEIPYEAHTTMEPMNSTAYIHDGICEVWAPTQDPQGVCTLVSMAVDMPEDHVIINVPLIGGGFGRRLEADYAVEAARVAKQAGAPVQVIWTRDDDIQHDVYHDMSVQYISAPRNQVIKPMILLKPGSSSIRTGAWRSVENFPTAYATGCYLDELALDMKRDPLDLLLELYPGPAAQVIQLAAEKASWGKPMPQGTGLGLAYHATWGVTHVAEVAEVRVDAAGNVRVPRVVAVVDGGPAVNPDNIKAQIEGGIAFGLTAALKAEITIKEGRTQQSNFHDCPLLTIDEMPLVEVYILESNRTPSGMGEMGIPPIAPAVANAVFAATGKRIRHIPIKPEDLAG